MKAVPCERAGGVRDGQEGSGEDRKMKQARNRVISGLTFRGLRGYRIRVIRTVESVQRVRSLSQAVRGMKVPFGFVGTCAVDFPLPVRHRGWYGFE
jgi:hypothetical protein